MGEGVRRRCMSRPPPTAAQGMSVRTGSGASEARDRAPQRSVDSAVSAWYIQYGMGNGFRCTTLPLLKNKIVPLRVGRRVETCIVPVAGPRSVWLYVSGAVFRRSAPAPPGRVARDALKLAATQHGEHGQADLRPTGREPCPRPPAVCLFAGLRPGPGEKQIQVPGITRCHHS